MSKLTIRSSGCTCRDPNIWVKWKEFFTWCAEFPVSWLNSPVKCLASWYVGAPMLLTMGLRGTPSLCIFGSPYNLGGLEPAGCSCLRIYPLSQKIYILSHRRYISSLTEDICPLSQKIYVLSHRRYISSLTEDIYPLSQKIYVLFHRRYMQTTASSWLQSPKIVRTSEDT